jgi:hypothetical protein
VGPQKEGLLSRCGLLCEGLEPLEEGLEVVAWLATEHARVDGADELLGQHHLHGARLALVGVLRADVE